VASAIEWLEYQQKNKTLNIADPRERKWTGVYRLTRELLAEANAAKLS
jgi:hypothetical protein